MSQVIVTQDKLQSERSKSAAQEHRISREVMFTRWRMRSTEKAGPLFFLASALLIPVVVLWGVLFIVLGGAITFFLMTLRFIGSLLGRR